MKHTKKRVAALLLTLAMVLSLMPMAFAADEYPDGMPAEDDASYAAVKSAVDNGIISGENGNLNLEDSIIRSTMAAMVTRTFGAKGETTLSGYSDVDDSHWAVQQGALPAAVQMGIMNGSNGKMMANDPVTREQAWAMLARALKLEKGTAADLEGIPGADSLSVWAIPEIASLVKAGYISDVSGATEPMTRVEFAEVIYSVSGGNYVKEGGEYTEDVNGNIIITADGVSLKGITVKGDVIIADGVDAGTINLDGVTIEGRLLVRGGSEVALTNGTTAAEGTVVAKTSDEVTVSADNDSDAGAITVDAKADKVTVDMPEPNVTIASATEVAVQNAEGGSVTLAASGASVAVESGTLENVTVADGASDVKVDVAEGATIEMVSTNTDVTITGDGKVEEKEGSGTVTDASGNEVGGSDEPVDVPTVEEAPFPDVTNPVSTGHRHNYAGSPTNFDATRHTVACVNKIEGGETTITGCGEVLYLPHTFTDGTCACGYEEQKVTEGEVVSEGGNDCAEGNHDFELDEANEDYTPINCTTEAALTYACKNPGCTATRVDTHPATGHSYLLSTDPVKTYAATCAVEGKQTYECQNEDCDDPTKEVTIAMVPHTYTSVVTQAATCAVKGILTKTCSVCPANAAGHTTTEEIAKTTTHTWEYANDDGTHKASCSVCQTTAGAPSHAASPSTSWSTDGENHWRTCTVAGCGVKIDNGAHSYGDDNTAKACTVCSYPKPAPVEPEGHEYVKDSSNWTTSTTEHWHGCTDDDCDNAEHVSDKANHDWTGKTGSCDVCEMACPNTENHKPDEVAKGETACATCGLEGTKEEVVTNP